jgi:phosphate transport system substrate-binding protein
MNAQTQIGQYILVRKLGEGGMAEVWEGSHIHLNTQVAIKFLLPLLATNAELQTRFLEEGKRQARLRHPNIVSALDFIQVDGRSYLVMEYIDGENLEARLGDPQRPLSPGEIHAVSWDVLSALDYAHSISLVHRDVKPSNILLDRGGRILLTDFGIALVLSETRRTRTGTVLGTSLYMSPEQITRPREVDKRSDIYSFGCVLYAMMAGSPPFGGDGDTDYSIQDSHVRAAPQRPGERNPQISPQVEEVILRCLEKDPAKRFQSCGAVMNALDAAMKERNGEIQDEPPVPIRPSGPPLAVATGEHGLPRAVSQTVDRNSTLLETGTGGYSAATATPTPPPVLPPVPPPVVPQGPSTGGSFVPPPPPVKKKRLGLWIGIGAVAALAVVALYLLFFIPPETVLRLEGSTTVGDVLAPQMVEAFLSKEGASDIREQEGTGNEKDHHDVSAKLPGHWRRVLVTIVANGSGNSFTALNEGRADVGMASRPIKQNEVDLLARLGDMRSPACEHIVGLDGIALVVNPGNPVPPLTLAQVRGIYSGAITNWSQVGAPSAPIHLLGRNTESGTFDTFVTLVMGGNKSALSSNITVIENGDEIARRVASEHGDIGYVGLAQIGSATALQLSAGPEATPLFPSQFTVSTEDYVLSRRLFLYSPASPSDFARRFIDFALSAQGQDVVRKVGYVEQTPHFEQVAVPADAPESYRERVAGLRRMSLDFRFRTNSFDLDNKAIQDLPRVIAALSQNGISSGVQVLGFADSQGSPARNQDLSIERAQIVAGKLRAYGIEVDFTGFSSALPVGDNSTAEGRDKNRRVEIWAR